MQHNHHRFKTTKKSFDTIYFHSCVLLAYRVSSVIIHLIFFSKILCNAFCPINRLSIREIKFTNSLQINIHFSQEGGGGGERPQLIMSTNQRIK